MLKNKNIKSQLCCLSSYKGNYFCNVISCYSIWSFVADCFNYTDEFIFKKLQVVSSRYFDVFACLYLHSVNMSNSVLWCQVLLFKFGINKRKREKTPSIYKAHIVMKAIVAIFIYFCLVVLGIELRSFSYCWASAQ